MIYEAMSTGLLPALTERPLDGSITNAVFTHLNALDRKALILC